MGPVLTAGLRGPWERLACATRKAWRRRPVSCRFEQHRERVGEVQMRIGITT